MKFTSMFFPASAVNIRFIKCNYKNPKKRHLRKKTHSCIYAHIVKSLFFSILRKLNFSQIKIFTFVPLPEIDLLVVCTPMALSISICNAIIIFSGISCFGLQTLTLDYGG